MTTALATRNDDGAIARYGEAHELDELAQRFVQFFNIPTKDANLPSLKTAALKAAQLTVRFGLTPGVHIYIVKRAGVYAAEESLEAWKDAASKHARINGFLYDVQVREMTPEEVKHYTPPSERYTPEDRGAFARVIRFDIAREYKNIGMEYSPLWVKGFWRKEAYEDKTWDGQGFKSTGAWKSDTVPNQRTPQDVAVRRATRAALKSAFTLIQLDDLTEAQRMRVALAHIERETAPLLEVESTARELFVEQDGAVDVWDEQPTEWKEVAPEPSPAPPQATTNGKAAKSPSVNAQQAFHAQGVTVFGKQWDTARPWLLRRYTGKNTPANIREHTAEMSVAELNDVRISMVNFGDKFKELFAAHLAEVEAPAIDKPLEIDMATVDERDPDGVFA